MIRRIAVALAFLGASASAVPAGAAAPPPKLLIVMSVDQFSADLFDTYRGQFGGGLARLANGLALDHGYQSHAATETCPGHSTLLTGDRPARTGIIANAWVDPAAPRADKKIYCAEDERAPGTDSVDYKVSTLHLRVPTLGNVLKAAFPSSRVVAVSGKDRSAVMMSGTAADQRWYWDGKGAFVTDLTGASVPASIAAVNAAVAAEIATAQPTLESPPFCKSRATPTALPGRGPVGDGAFARAAGDATAFRTSPEADGAVLALSAALIREMNLGKGSSTDLMTIGLSATDYIGHAYGPGGQEMCLNLLSLDRDLGDFLSRLDNWGLDYAVVLTADHGGLDIPERLKLAGVADAARVDVALTSGAAGAAVSKLTGIGGPILADTGAGGDVYFNSGLSAADRAKAQPVLISYFRANPQVEAVFTKAEIAASPLPSGDPTGWTILQRVRASFDPARSGDLYVVFKPHIMPIAQPGPGYVATHGSPWDYDRRVPILFWRKGMMPVSDQRPVETVDIMPTLAAWLGLALAPGSVDGHCLAIAADCTTR